MKSLKHSLKKLSLAILLAAFASSNALAMMSENATSNPESAAANATTTTTTTAPVVANNPEAAAANAVAQSPAEKSAHKLELSSLDSVAILAIASQMNESELLRFSQTCKTYRNILLPVILRHIMELQKKYETDVLGFAILQYSSKCIGEEDKKVAWNCIEKSVELLYALDLKDGRVRAADRVHELFTLAAKKDLKEAINFLLNRNGELDKLHSCSPTAWECLNDIIQYYCDFNGPDLDLVKVALTAKKSSMALFLLTECGDRFRQSKQHMFEAESKCCMSVMVVLMQKGISPTVKDDMHNNALHRVAANSEALNVFKFLMTIDPLREKIDAKNEEKLTPLSIAMKSKNSGAVNVLLENGASVIKDGNTLFVAVMWGNPEMVSLLLKYPEITSVLNITNSDKETALIYAAKRLGNSDKQVAETYLKIFKSLLDAGAYVNCQDKNGYSALHCAAQAGNEPAVRMLLEKGADVSLKTMDNIEAYPITFAIAGEMSEEILALLSPKVGSRKRKLDSAPELQPAEKKEKANQ